MDREINYGALIDKAMHYIVKEALQIVTESGLPGNHHFFISFLTHYPGVVISERLRKKYPEEMTIVLQYQFEELAVTENAFSVVLSFDNIKERIVIPFMALSAFADPSVKFGLQFRHLQLPESEFEVEESSDLSTFEADLAHQKKQAERKKTKKEEAQEHSSMDGKSREAKTEENTDSETSNEKDKAGFNNVVQLDKFRNKKNKD